MKDKIKFLLKYLKTMPISIIFSFFASLIFIPSTLLIPYFTGKAIDAFDYAINNNYDQFIKEEVLYLALIGVLIILTIVFQYIYEAILNIVFEKVIKQIRDDVFTKLNYTNIKFIDTHLHGDLLSRCINDVETISNGLISGFKQFYQGVITIIITIGLMFYANYILALVILVLTPISFLISYQVARKSNKHFKKQAKYVGEVSANVLETFNNIDIIKSYSYDEEAYKNFNSINEKLNKVGQKAQFISSFTNPSTRLINNSIYAIVGIIGSLLVVFSDKVNLGATLTIGGITTFLQYANQFAKPLNEISSCISEIQASFVAIQRIEEIINLPDDVNEGSLTSLNEIHKLTFKDVGFSYDSKKIIYKDLDFEISKNKKVALVGPTGCGKTTIINLILRFYDPDNGIIYINDIDNKDIEKKVYRNNFGMVLQDSWIFKGTVFENIAFDNPNATLEEVIEASKKANCYDFITRLPKGFDTVISDESGLSSGEKQLICIARMMLKDAKFLILDEATSNVDTRTELKIGKALDELMKNKTSIVIAHRLSTIKTSDLILVINDGIIIEQGTHKELLAKGGFYHKLFTSQYS